ncbi:hypothetical protein M2152_002059 [Microbacteriaceae bacterium SG_E_30_P1]|uniref:Polysaccharide pyruvyl transferase WcaK-like protein n=1 Tax=Antiquaquibacter oligotrophicus TaxID=2880260 RepID=A0ABT6KRQ0_9MICO|nr:hypothetical protein [Antiquaquibacter oligotrophicus]MDH6181877.1 hypothetical protein [Antiquaquibacter oligotrophicus]UDF12448.1 hypothetical protein LH407_09795 [Antiquaquibacter oligotrophicus]
MEDSDKSPQSSPISRTESVRNAAPREVFVILTGVSGNLGDAVIRRRVLEWCRGLGRVHAYVGRTTPGWLGQLALSNDEVLYRAKDRRRWLKELLLHKRAPVLVFDPGEVPLGTEHLRSEIMFLGIVAMVRLKGGFIFRPPRAVGSVHPVVGWVYRTSSRLSNIVLWRETPSLERMRVGKISPDTAFGEPRTPGLPHGQRRVVIVSMRGKRPIPPAEWFEGIASFAKRHDYRIVAVSQVDEDEVRSAELAERFGGAAEYIPWGERSDKEQETSVRALYETAAIAISDRLHVLILAAKAGALPVEIAESPRPKVREHFRTVGIHSISYPIAGSAAEVDAFLEQQISRVEEISTLVDDAEAKLQLEIDNFRAAVKANRD